MHQLNIIEEFLIPEDWDELAPCYDGHESVYLEVLNHHGFGDIKIPIPLTARYTKGRRWTKSEFESCYQAWKRGVSLTLIAAALNRNPQDMIYKLLDRCKRDGLNFTQKDRSAGSANWTVPVEKCAQELFEKELPAWKIAALFRVDFEHVEKALFAKRKGYGHKKKNPFAICTDHKQVVNKKIIDSRDMRILRALDAYCGEGRFSRVIQDIEELEELIAIEIDDDTFKIANSASWKDHVSVLHDDNLNYFRSGACKRFHLIDLDPFVTCHEQLDLVWDFLEEESYLFVTFGGEYRRSFIKTNRKSISSRYGFYNGEIDNKKYLEVVPYFFAGHIAKKASDNGFAFDVIRAVRYANNCRFWLKVKHVGIPQAKSWFDKVTKSSDGGFLMTDLKLPRFREVRQEIDEINKGIVA